MSSARIFAGRGITKVLTIKASGIQFAMAAGIALGVPFVYAKKKKAVTLTENLYTAQVYSFTRQETYQVSVSQSYLGGDDRVLIVDDFLATGAALLGLVDIVSASGAALCGVGCVIEKTFQEGRRPAGGARCGGSLSGADRFYVSGSGDLRQRHPSGWSCSKHHLLMVLKR